MNRKLPIIERLLIFMSLFCFGVLFYRCLFTLSLHYTFLLWNLLLAFVPYILSKELLKCRELNVKSVLLLFAWLMFFPACVYLFTDMLKMHETADFAFVYNIALFACFAFTGLLPGLASLKKTEAFLMRHISPAFAKISILLFIFFSSYGICLARFLHLKSWNVITDFKEMLHASELNIAAPIDHLHIWLSIVIVVLLIDMAYAGYKKLYYVKSDQFSS